jgi:hypothetical protein
MMEDCWLWRMLSCRMQDIPPLCLDTVASRSRSRRTLAGRMTSHTSHYYPTIVRPCLPVRGSADDSGLAWTFYRRHTDRRLVERARISSGTPKGKQHESTCTHTLQACSSWTRQQRGSRTQTGSTSIGMSASCVQCLLPSIDLIHGSPSVDSGGCIINEFNWDWLTT